MHEGWLAGWLMRVWRAGARDRLLGAGWCRELVGAGSVCLGPFSSPRGAECASFPVSLSLSLSVSLSTLMLSAFLRPPYI